ncbi:MAG TPA: hypothetical protein VK722_22600 [Candidatus Aquilonibacter sp.]|nr:hypothetical protein [Candidatus Aquilonibacter sp.]
MRVRWINHPNPKLQHLNGLIQHEPYEAVAPYILSGQAEEAPFKTYQERLKYEEELRMASQPKEQPLWGIHELLHQVTVTKSFAGQVDHYDRPPADCPAFIRQRWQAAFDRIVGMNNDLSTAWSNQAESRRHADSVQGKKWF